MLKMSGGMPGLPDGQREEEAVWDGGKSFSQHHRARPAFSRTLQVLYLVGFPILLLMIIVGGLKAAAPGEENASCPAEPNMPWFLVSAATH